MSYNPSPICTGNQFPRSSSPPINSQRFTSQATCLYIHVTSRHKCEIEVQITANFSKKRLRDTKKQLDKLPSFANPSGMFMSNIFTSYLSIIRYVSKHNRRWLDRRVRKSRGTDPSATFYADEFAWTGARVATSTMFRSSDPFIDKLAESVYFLISTSEECRFLGEVGGEANTKKFRCNIFSEALKMR